MIKDTNPSLFMLVFEECPLQLDARADVVWDAAHHVSFGV